VCVCVNPFDEETWDMVRTESTRRESVLQRISKRLIKGKECESKTVKE
jgi:hypothetical protein